jgi:cysteine desulfurase
MERIYLDNAATTAVDPKVKESMLPYFMDDFGNPSSTHSHGRAAKSALENARKKVAELLNASSSEIFFTSGGTEGDNTALSCGISTFGLKHAITSPTEHHAVLNTLENEERKGHIKLSLVNVDQEGFPDLDHLRFLMKNNPRSILSLMHANNEIGTKIDLIKIGHICQEHKAVFHSDTVQTMCHYPHDIQTLDLNFMVGSAHKFHGPKGVGFLYVNRNSKIHPYILGGTQERNMRGGTENVAGIVGLSKAMEIAYESMDEHQSQIQGLKTRMIQRLENQIPGIKFNGNPKNPGESLYTVLNVSLPESEDNNMLLFNLDLHGISCSAGSACISGSNKGSHVLEAIKADPKKGAIRFSFSKFNTKKEIDTTVDILARIVKSEYSPA